MKHYPPAALTAVAFGLAGCAHTIPGGMELNPPVTQSLTASTRPQSVAPYIYVSDGQAKVLRVYSKTGTLIRSVPLDAAPIGGVATDSQGRIYVAEQLASKVQIFDKQGTEQIGVISVYEPDGVAVDSHDNVYITQHITSGPTTFIDVFAAGKYAQMSRQIASPKNYAFEGVAVNHEGDVFATVYENQGGFLLEYPGGGPSFKIIDGICLAAGVGIDASGDVEVANCATLTEYVAPSYHQGRSTHYGRGEAIHWIGRGQDGAIYVPINDPADPHVLVYPSTGSRAQYRITDGLQSPVGAAAGQ